MVKSAGIHIWTDTFGIRECKLKLKIDEIYGCNHRYKVVPFSFYLNFVSFDEIDNFLGTYTYCVLVVC